MNAKLPIVVVGLALLVVYVSQSVSGPVRGPKRAGGSQLHRTYSKSGHRLGSLEKRRIAELAAALSQEERRVLLEEGTERAFTGSLVKNKKKGIYACRLCGLPLYASEAKFESGTGWPSFFKPIDPAHVHEERDTKFGSVRTEIECARCRSHLGHVFDDGPKPTGLRYCMNSASLMFYAAGADLPPESRPVELTTAYFAGGCFWGIEEKFQQVPGVVEAVSGYQGGKVDNPGYKEISRGDTGHAETVRVTFDASRVSYAKLLEWFFKFHDPRQVNRQGPDIGTQYRSAIFAANDKQLAAANAFIKEQQGSTRFRDQKIATVVERAGKFFEAEAYHQDYHERHGGSCSIGSGE